MSKAGLMHKGSVTILSLLFLLLACALSAAETQAELPTPAPAIHEPSHSQAHEPGMFDIDLTILVSQTINFFVLLYLLNRFLFIPISGIIDERRRNLSNIKLLAEAEHQSALELKQDYERHLASVDEEIYEIRQKAILDAQHRVEEIIQEARRKAEEIIEHGEMEIFMERQTAWARIREEVVQLTLTAAEKVVEESLDDELHRKLIASTIQKLENDLPDHR